MPNDSTLYGGPNFLAEGSGGMVSPGAAAYQGFAQELYRRQAQQAAAEELQRQAVKDAQDAEIKKAQLEVQQQQAQGLKEQREATSKKANQDLLMATTKPGQVTPEVADQFSKAGLGYLMLSKPGVPAMVGGGPIENPTAEDLAASPATEAVPATTEFTGSVAQQKDKEQEDFAREVLAGKHTTGNDRVDQYLQAQAVQILGGGKFGTIPAGVINEPKEAGATKAAHDLKMEGVERDMKLGKPVAPELQAEYEVWKTRNSTDQEKADKAAAAAAAAAARVDARTARTQLFQTKQQFRRELTDNEKNLDKDVERSDRALALLNSPNFVTDAVAGPEFLQIVAGGMGSGLRMTDAELRRINEAQTKIDQLKGYLAKWDILPNQQRVTIQNEMRGSMKAALEAVHAARTRKSKLASETLAKLGDIEDEGTMDKAHATYWEDRVAAGAMNQPAKPEAAAAPSRRTARNPKTGEVLYSDNGGPWHK